MSRKNAGFDGLEDPDDASLEGSDSGASAEDDDLDAVDAVDGVCVCVRVCVWGVVVWWWGSARGACGSVESVGQQSRRE